VLAEDSAGLNTHGSPLPPVFHRRRRAIPGNPAEFYRRREVGANDE
jgi:hypothetical protein